MGLVMAYAGRVAIAGMASIVIGGFGVERAAAQDVDCASMFSDMSDRLRREAGWYAGHYARVKDRGAVTHDSTGQVTLVRQEPSGALVAARFQDEHAGRTDETSLILYNGSNTVDVILHSWGDTRLRGEARYCRYSPNQDYDVGGQADDDTMLVFGTYEEGNGQTFFTLALSRMGPAG